MYPLTGTLVRFYLSTRLWECAAHAGNYPVRGENVTRYLTICADTPCREVAFVEASEHSVNPERLNFTDAGQFYNSECRRAPFFFF